MDLPVINALWDYSKPDVTGEKFRELLPQAIAAGNTAYVLELQTQIARTLGLQMKFQQAHALLDEIEPQLQGQPPVVLVRYNLERGRTLNSSSNAPESLPFFSRALQAALQAGLDGYAVDALHMLAIADVPENQLTWNMQALELATASGQEDARRWTGSLYNNIGWTHFFAGRYAQALDYFNRMLDWWTQKNQQNQIFIARWSVARTLRALGRTGLALGMQQQLLELIQSGQAEQDGYVYEELAECLMAMGQSTEATPHFNTAFRLLSKDPWLARDQPDRLARLAELGGAIED